MASTSTQSTTNDNNLAAARQAVAQGNLPLALALLTSYLTEQDPSDEISQPADPDEAARQSESFHDLFTAHSMRAQLLLATSDTMAATDDIVWLQRLAPDAKESLLLAAQYEKQRGNKNESLRLFSRLFELYPELMTQVSGNF